MLEKRGKQGREPKEARVSWWGAPPRRCGLGGPLKGGRKGNDVAKRRQRAQRPSPTRPVREPACDLIAGGSVGCMGRGAGKTSEDLTVEMLGGWAEGRGFDFIGCGAKHHQNLAFRKVTLSRMDFWGTGETSLGVGKDKQAGRRGPEGAGALMRAVRAIVSLFGNSVGEAMRKVAKVTGLGSGMPRAKREEQLLTRREIWVNPVQFHRHPGGDQPAAAQQGER